MDLRGTKSPGRSDCQRLAVAAVVGLGALALPACGDDPPFPFDDATCQAAIEGPGAVDALPWLKDPYGGEKQLGSWSTDAGLAFAIELETRGATRIWAVGVSKQKGPPPSEQALGLVAEMPDDPFKRRRIFEFHARQVRSAGYKPRADTGQKYLFFCWKT